jgi:hypothetical protein
MKKLNLFNIVAVAATISLTSCRLTDFTIVSTKNVTIEVKKDAERVTAKGWTVKDAIDHAIEKAGPGYDALIDGVIYNSGFRYKVTGTPINTSETKK